MVDSRTNLAKEISLLVYETYASRIKLNKINRKSEKRQRIKVRQM